MCYRLPSTICMLLVNLCVSADRWVRFNVFMDFKMSILLQFPMTVLALKMKRRFVLSIFEQENNFLLDTVSGFL